MTIAFGTSLRIVALGRFSENIPPLAPRLEKINAVPIRSLSLEQLPEQLLGSDVLLADLDWLSELSPEQCKQLSLCAAGAAAWIVLVDDMARFKVQITWQRLGVTHFFHRPLDPEQLAGLIEDIHDRLAGPPIRAILLDDDASSLSYCQEILSQAGVHVLATQDPLLLLEVLHEHQPDVLVLDIEMPGCRGPELACIVRQHQAYERLPVIFLTGKENLQNKLQACAASAEDFLTKPVVPELLCSVVDSHARRYRSLVRREQFGQQQQERARSRLEQLREAIDEHAIVSIADANGNIVHVNDKFCAISGYQRQELLGKNHRLVKSNIHSRDFYEELWQTIGTGKPWHGEVCNRRRCGEIYWVEASIIPFLDAQGLPYQYISIRTDITHIKAAEQALQQREQMFRLLVTSVADGIVLHDSNGTVTECNPAAERILGLSRAQILGRDSLDPRWHCIHPDGKPFHSTNHPAMVTLATGTPLSDVIMGVCRKDGSLAWININSEPLSGNGPDEKRGGVVVSFSDITHTREAADRLRRSLSQLEATVKAIPDLLFELDINGRYLDCHYNDQELLAASPEELSSKTVDDVMPPNAASIVKTALGEAAIHGVSYGKQIWLDVPKGRCCFELSVARKNYFDSTDDQQFVLLSRDITGRKKSELALAERERQLQEAQQLAHLGSWTANLETGEVDWSDEVFRIFGQDPASFTPTTRDFMTAVHPDDRLRVQESEQKAETSGMHDVRHRIIRPDGSIRHVRELARGEMNEVGRIVRLVGTVQDITEQVEADARLWETETRFAFAVEGAGDGIWDWNMATGAFVFSGHYESMLGFAIGEIRGNLDTWVDSVHPDDLPAVKQQLQEYLEGTRLAYAVELRLRCKDGTYKWILCRGTVVECDGNGKPIRMIGIHSDISERKRDEEALLVFRRLVETTDQAIRVSDHEGNIQYVNPAYEKLLGYAAKEVLGKQFVNIGTAPDQHDLVPKIIDELKETGRWQGFLKLRDKKGREFVSQSNIRTILSPETGELLHSFNMFVDYSTEIARQKALEQAVAEANAANQAKSTFLSSMSHELRTPMNAIIGFTQMLEYDSELTADQQDNVHEILKAGKHLLELINEVLDLAKIESGRIDLSLEPVDTTVLIDECRQLIQPLATRRNISIELDLPPGLTVRADRVRLKQVLLNLLSNAVKYNRNHGSIRLSVNQTENHVRLSVTDTGIGIAQERLAEVFQPFNRLNAESSQVEGTGIGLTITKRLTELMGGDIGLDSTPGKGCTFWIELPAESSATYALDAPSKRQENGLAMIENPYCVLCIDDNPANLKLVAQILGMRRHIILLTAHTPELGIELAMAHQPHLILLDINMPGMDGYQVLAVFQADPYLKNIPVLAVTANAMPRDIERGKAAGFMDYVTKPIDIKRFLQTIDHLLQSTANEQSLPQEHRKQPEQHQPWQH